MKKIDPREPGEQWAQLPPEGISTDEEPRICGLPTPAIQALGDAGLVPIVQVRIPGSEEIFELVHLTSLNRYLLSLLPANAQPPPPKVIPKIAGVLA